MSEPKPENEVICLRIPSRLELLSVLDRVALSLCERLEFDEDTASQVTLSLIEAGTNAIQHAHKLDPSKSFEVNFTLHPDALEISVHDHGTGFAPEGVNGNIDSPEHLLDVRGRGIYIMRACMDSVDFSFDGTGTVCRMIKRRPPAAARG
jgi:serine/threonine-protein kinase RsbW